jgi:hypothetical protein
VLYEDATFFYLRSDCRGRGRVAVIGGAESCPNSEAGKGGKHLGCSSSGPVGYFVVSRAVSDSSGLSSRALYYPIGRLV